MVTSSHNKRLLWSAVTLSFFGLLRSSEITSSWVNRFISRHTSLVADVTFAPGMSYVSVNVKSSKADPFRVGCIVRIGATSNQVCPVSALHHFLNASPNRQGPLFTFSDGSYLTRSRLTSLLSQCLGNNQINTHSVRIGGTSTMASAGLSDSTILTLDRWNSNAYQQYIRISDSSICRNSRIINLSYFIN